MLSFVGRTVARRTQVGQRQTVQQEEYYCHAFNKDGLVGIAFVDADYPARAGFCVVNKVLEDFMLLRGDAWRGATADAPDQAQQLLADAVQKYQVRGLLGVCVAGQGRGCSCGAVATSLRRAGTQSSPPATLHRTRRLRISWPRYSGTWMRPRSSCTRR